MVGELIGEGAAQEQTVVGETPNLAARLQTLAPPGGVVISQATRRLVGGLFELQDLGPQRLKGSPSRWRPFRSSARVTPKAASRRCTASISRRWSDASTSSASCSSAGPGRGTATARWCCCRASPGSASRACPGAARAPRRPAVHPLSHFCSPYHTNSALYPVIGLLERAARLERDESPEEKLDQARGDARRSSDWLDEAVPLFAALLGVPPGSVIRR